MATNFTLAIIAGGKSSRMGTDKAFVNILGKSVIEHIIERLKDIGQEETILITNHAADYAHLSLPMYSDVYPEKGSLGGIYTAIYHSSSPYTFVVACDMPFVSPDLMRYMVALAEVKSFDAIVPRVDGVAQGVFALYNKFCLPLIQMSLSRNELKVISFYKNVRMRYVDEIEHDQFNPKGLAFYNVNTPLDLEEARRLAEGDTE